MAEMSKELRNRIDEFILAEIGSKAVSGITFVSKVKEDRNRDEINKYISLRKAADDEGFKSDELFRTFEVANGYTFDVDLGIVLGTLRSINNMINAAEEKEESQQTASYVHDIPISERKEEIKRLAEYIIENAGEGKLNVALYSTVLTDSIEYVCSGGSGKYKAEIEAFRVSDNDFEVMNKSLLVPNGYMVESISRRYILPHESGVAVELVVKEV